MKIKKFNSSCEAKYANNFRVGYNANEILIEFSQIYDQEQNTCTHTRIVTSPNYAKELLDTLLISLNNYEKQYGIILDSAE